MEPNKSSLINKPYFSLLGTRPTGVICPCPKQHSKRLHHSPKQSVWQTLTFPTVCAADTPSATERIEAVQKAQTQSTATFVTEMEVQEFLRNETGTDRLRMMFTTNRFGETSPEFQLMSQVTINTAALTFLITSFIGGRHAKEDFVRQNQATVFQTRFRAFRALQDSIFLRSVKDGTKWAVKVSFFTLSLLGISQCIAVYRNKTTPWEYVAGFGLTGALTRVSLGPKGMFAGGVFGSAMGLVAGLIFWGTMNVLNETQEQRHYWQIQKYLEAEKVAKGLATPSSAGDPQPQPLVQ